MAGTLVDSSILLDILTEDGQWLDWSSSMLEAAANSGPLLINPIIYAEISIGYDKVEEVEQALPPDLYRREPLPYEAAFLAGKCYRNYRKRGGARRSPLPDFYVGAHAAIAGYRLLTRDARRYRTYFPTVQLIAP